jgi:hypothetical protein
MGRVGWSITGVALGADIDGRSCRKRRVLERRRAVALARHCREVDGLSNTQIAERLGRSTATVKAYFYDPPGDKARAVKARYVGVCRAAAPTRSSAMGRATRTRTARDPNPAAGLNVGDAAEKLSASVEPDRACDRGEVGRSRHSACELKSSGG